MKFTLLLTAKPNSQPTPGSDAWAEYASAYGAWNQAAAKADMHRCGEPLLPPQSSKTVCRSNNKINITDGPAENHAEPIIDRYLIECTSINEAVEWASKIPWVEGAFGKVEVRPVVEY